jgi:hypothetical protein
MKQTIRTIGLGLSLVLTLACGDDDEGHADLELEGLQKCCYIGQICHEGDSAETPDIGACHDIGHQNDPEACRAKFDMCKMLCDPEDETTLPDSCEDPSGDPHEEESGH